MAILAYIRITCDKCGCLVPEEIKHLTGMQQRKEYKKFNWVYSGNIDLCPNCRAHRKDGQYYAHFKRRPRRKQ